MSQYDEYIENSFTMLSHKIQMHNKIMKIITIIVIALHSPNINHIVFGSDWFGLKRKAFFSFNLNIPCN